MKFTAHNIVLSNGKKTLDENQIALNETAVWKSIVNTLELFNLLPQGEGKSKLKVVDLGCLEGGYAVEFAKLGFETLGIEAREENVEKCNYLKADLNLSNVEFVTDDVRNLEKYGKFDIVLCYGLLYHLNDPIDFLKILSGCTNKLLLLNTHFAPERDLRYDLGFLNTYFLSPLQKRIGKLWIDANRMLHYRINYRLSRLTLNEGYKGRWKKEYNKKISKNKLESLLWSSYNNDRSFWVCKKDLTKAMHDVGFHSVFEQFNFTGDIWPDEYTEYYNRTMFVAVKH